MLSALRNFFHIKKSSQENYQDREVALSATDEDRLLAGWKFCATLQIRTPKKYLLMHGKILPKGEVIQPKEMWQGILVPSLKEEFQLDVPNRTCASDIGPVSDSEYLPFLLKLRSLVETEQSINDRIESLKASSWTEQERGYVAGHGGIDALAEKFFPPSLGEIGFTAAQIAQLYERGIYTPVQVNRMSDEDILSVKGIGATRLRKIREMILPFSAYDHARLDAVLLD